VGRTAYKSKESGYGVVKVCSQGGKGGNGQDSGNGAYVNKDLLGRRWFIFVREADSGQPGGGGYPGNPGLCSGHLKPI
jgi:hypothetical protein